MCDTESEMNFCLIKEKLHTTPFKPEIFLVWFWSCLLQLLSTFAKSQNDVSSVAWSSKC